MLLTPTELERLTIFTAAELARKRQSKKLKLNHPEAVAIIVDEVLEGAREGRSVAELISHGATILTTDDVMEGVRDMTPIIQVECMFPDGTKLVTVHDPIRPGKEAVAETSVHPGEFGLLDGNIEINAGRKTSTLKVLNTGDRPIQVGSHFHFFETNRFLEFDRDAAFGMRLDIPAGTAVRFEPGESKEVTLTQVGGSGEVIGLNNLTNGSVRSDIIKAQALHTARQRGYKGA